jgi:hypothetical protein
MFFVIFMVHLSFFLNRPTLLEECKAHAIAGLNHAVAPSHFVSSDVSAA